jgi:hypothetical protein
MTTLIDITLDSIVENFNSIRNESIRGLPLIIQQKLLSLLITHNKLTNENVKGFLHEFTTSLKLSGIFFERRISLFTGASSCISDSLVDPLNVCEHLRELSLYNCTNISEDNMARIFKVCSYCFVFNN